MSDASTVRVLVVDDDELMRAGLRTVLSSDQTIALAGEASSGRGAVSAVRAYGPDLVLMDVRMPDLDGIAATRRIRAAEAAAGGPRTPIIALTANVMAHQVQDYVEAGMDAHVSKPIQAEALFRAIAEAVAEPAEADDGVGTTATLAAR